MEMKRIFKLIVGVEAAVGAEVGAARMESQANLDKKYTAEGNARLVKLAEAVTVEGFSGK